LPEDPAQLLQREGLAQVIRHARPQALLTVALHRVCGQRHDRDWSLLAPCLLQAADRRGRLQAVHLRHLHVHEHQVEPRAGAGRRGFPAVLGHLDLAAQQLEHAHGERLVDGMVLGQQHSAGEGLRGHGRLLGRRGLRLILRRRGGGEHPRDTVAEHRLPDRLGHPALDPRVEDLARVVDRAEHDDRGPFQLRIRRDVPGKLQPIHARHVVVKRGQGERRPRPGSGGERLQGARTVLGAGAGHPPCPRDLLEDEPVGRVVVDDEDVQAGRHGRGGTAASCFSRRTVNQKVEPWPGVPSFGSHRPVTSRTWG